MDVETLNRVDRAKVMAIVTILSARATRTIQNNELVARRISAITGEHWWTIAERWGMEHAAWNREHGR